MRAIALAWCVVLTLAAGACSQREAARSPGGETQRILSEYSRTGRSGPALEQAHQAVTTWPDDAAVRVCYSRMLFKAGKLEEAEGQVQRALASPSIRPYDQMHALTLQAHVAFCRGEWNVAAARCDEALAIDPAANWPVIAEARRLQARVRCLRALEAWPRRETTRCVVHAPTDTPADVDVVAATATATIERLQTTLGVVVAGVHIYLYNSAEHADEYRIDHAQEYMGRVVPDIDVRARQVHAVHDQPLGPYFAQIVTARLGDVFIDVPLIEDGASQYFGRDPATSMTATVDPPAAPLAEWRYVPQDEAAQAAAFVGWLVEEHGIQRFKRLWQRLAWEPLEIALQTAYETPVADLDAAWRAARAGKPGAAADTVGADSERR